ncbi:winged helix DNA-binding domain-containing protein, partial [Marasmius fiardii PR-910]
AERILRSVHNLPYGVPISLSALPDPLPGMKPRQSYNTLVQIAIWESREKRLTLKGIYEALERRFSWCRDHPDSRKWKNSIRHMLSNRNVFVLVREEEWDLGRGGWWELDFGDVEGSRRGERR